MAAVDHYEVHLRDYLYVLRKRRGVILAFALFVFAAGIFMTFRQRVLYRANATILIEKENPNIVDFKEVMALDASTTDYYQTQYQMLRSRSLIHTLVESKNLEQDPYLTALQKKGMLKRLLEKPEFLKPWVKGFLSSVNIEDTFNRKMLRIDPVRNSRLVEVSVLHPDPEKSAELTNELVQLFIQRSVEDRFSMSRQATDLINTQLVELKERVAVSEKKLQDYKSQQGLVKLPSIREQNKFLEEAKLELIKIQSEESKLAKRYLPAHPKRIHIRSQIEGLEEKIKDEEKKILDLGGAAIEYAQLEREADSASKIYESLLSRVQETTSEAKTQASNIMIVDKAQIPMKPYEPRPLLNLMISLILGAAGGILLAFFCEYLDSTLKIPDDVEKALGLDLFGIIPKTETSKKLPLQGAIFYDPKEPSPAAEAFRALRTALLFRLRHQPGCRVLLVTSPNPGEGKTSISLNLTAAFQQNHLKVLLIDADLRKPRLHKVLNLSAGPGLSDYLESQVSLDQAIQKNAAQQGFDFLSCGSFSEHPTEILGSEIMDKLMAELKKQYDVILLDTPPYLAVADVAVLSEYADAMVFVGQYQKTDRRHLKTIKKRFQLEHPIMGVVINCVSVREKDYYYHQYYYYGYGDAGRKK